MGQKKSQLTPAMKKEIVELTIETYNREIEKTRKAARDRVLHNTKLLLVNYRSLVSHSQSAIYEALQCDEDVYDILSAMTGYQTGNDLYVESIKRSAAKTKIIIEHIKRAVDDYELYCARSGRAEEMRRCRTVRRLYIDDEDWDVQRIADDEIVDISTVYKDVKEAVKRLTPRIFGIEGLL